MAIILIRTLIIFLALIVAMRLMGKRQLGELELSELVVAVLIADIASIPLQNPSLPLSYGLIPLLVLFCCELIFSGLTYKSILDRKAGAFMHSIASVKGTDTVSKTHSKGGGILHTVHDNLLIGPDAVETYEKENTATCPESIAHVFGKQKITMPALTERDIITYFTGVRAPTFEEDFIIERGRIAQQAMHRNRFTLDELTQELRNQGILDIASVEYAVLETNGQLNIILAPAQQPVTAEQMQIETEDAGYFSILINNGRILRDNLKRMGRDERWLQKQVQQRGTQCIEDVYLLMMNDAGQIYFAAKERR